MRLTLAIATLALAGCGQRTQINPGADLAVYVGSTAHMHAKIPPGHNRATSAIWGYYSPADGSITISEQLRGVGIARTFAHELAHAFDHQRPDDLWDLLVRYQSPEFNFNLHGEHRDVVRAVSAARHAASEAAP